MRVLCFSCSTRACQNKSFTVKPFSSQTHSCCFSSVLMWPSSSSSLYSFWHRCLCWARKRNTATLQKKINKEWNNIQRLGKTETTHIVWIKSKKTGTFCWLCHLLSAAFCRSISSSKLSLCSTKLSMFWRHSLSSSLEKRNNRDKLKCWHRETQNKRLLKCAQSIRLMDFLVVIAIKGR